MSETKTTLKWERLRDGEWKYGRVLLTTGANHRSGYDPGFKVNIWWINSQTSRARVIGGGPSLAWCKKDVVKQYDAVSERETREDQS